MRRQCNQNVRKQQQICAVLRIQFLFQLPLRQLNNISLRTKMCSKVYCAVFFACVDDGIGKFDRSMLSQQELMELFIFGLNEPEKICGNRDDPVDVCEWKGITCNDDGEVEEFHWINKTENGTGTLGFEFLPWSMKTVRMFINALSGTIQLADLPGMMEELLLDGNQLTGSLELDRLPADVQGLALNSNKFTGEVSLENLPKCLEYLSLAENQLSGTICLTALPPALECMFLEKNNFEGSIDFTRLPKSMRYIYLSDNRFSGTVDLGNLPESMEELNVRKNTLSGTVRVPEHAHRKFDGNLGVWCFEENNELTVERV